MHAWEDAGQEQGVSVQQREVERILAKKDGEEGAPCECGVEMEYREMLFQLETEHSDKELYRIIAQSRPVQMISY